MCKVIEEMRKEVWNEAWNEAWGKASSEAELKTKASVRRLYLRGLSVVKQQIVSGENGALFSTISPLNGILFSVTARSWRKKRHAVRRLIP